MNPQTEITRKLKIFYDDKKSKCSRTFDFPQENAKIHRKKLIKLIKNLKRKIYVVFVNVWPEIKRNFQRN